MVQGEGSLMKNIFCTSSLLGSQPDQVSETPEHCFWWERLQLANAQAGNPERSAANT